MPPLTSHSSVTGPIAEGLARYAEADYRASRFRVMSVDAWSGFLVTEKECLNSRVNSVELLLRGPSAFRVQPHRLNVRRSSISLENPAVQYEPGDRS